MADDVANSMQKWQVTGYFWQGEWQKTFGSRRMLKVLVLELASRWLAKFANRNWQIVKD